ncbi:MAG: hypothetical protein ABSD78_03050 [Acidimicrobiales bacterium]
MRRSTEQRLDVLAMVGFWIGMLLSASPAPVARRTPLGNRARDL